MTTFGLEKISPRKSAPNNFFPQQVLYVKGSCSCFTLLIHLATCRTATLGIFTHFTFMNLPRCSRTINSLINVYSIQIPAAFYRCLISHDHTSSYYLRPKKLSVLRPENLQKNEQSLQIQLKSLQEQIHKSNQKSKPKTQEHINRRTVEKSCFKCGRLWPHCNGESPGERKICTKCRKPNHFAKICKSINTNVVNYEDDNTLEYINSYDIPSSKTCTQHSTVELQKLIANIKIDNVKVKFPTDTGSSANIWRYETLQKMSKLNMNNCKLKKTSFKLIPFGSSSQNSFISVKGTLSVLLKTEEHFSNAMFYFMLLKTT